MRSLWLSFLLAISVQARASEPTTSTCHNAEYLKFSLSDGVKQRDSFFANVPCRYLRNIEEAIQKTAPAGDGAWQFFRFRALEQPGVKTFTVLEHAGTGLFLGYRRVGVKVAETVLEQLEKEKQLPLEQRLYGWMVLKNGSLTPEQIEKMKGDGAALEAYFKDHLVLFAFPDRA